MSRFGMGPVFQWEWRRVSRQWWFYALRAAIVGGLLAGLAAAWWAFASRPDLNVPRAMAQVGEAFFIVIALGQIAMVLLAAPAATAGMFGMEKARGHVCLMLMTEVNSLDIVLGILAARMLPVLGGILCTVPVLALTSHLGGVPPSAMVDLLCRDGRDRHARVYALPGTLSRGAAVPRGARGDLCPAGGMVARVPDPDDHPHDGGRRSDLRLMGPMAAGCQPVLDGDGADPPAGVIASN